jgi:hypothetical protein
MMGDRIGSLRECILNAGDQHKSEEELHRDVGAPLHVINIGFWACDQLLSLPLKTCLFY